MASETTKATENSSENLTIESNVHFSYHSSSTLSNNDNQREQDTLNDNRNNEMSRRLNHELALSATHRQQVESHWRQILRKEKFQELHAQISSLSDFHNKNVQRKKYVIQSVEREIE